MKGNPVDGVVYSDQDMLLQVLGEMGTAIDLGAIQEGSLAHTLIVSLIRKIEIHLYGRDIRSEPKR